MPFIKRAVDPVYISRRSPENDENEELLSVSNWTLSQALRQLGSLVKHANDIFADVTLEFQAIGKRTERLSQRTSNLKDLVESLDYKTAIVPESDLKTVNGIIEHFHLHNGYDCDLFVRDTRPACIRNLYDGASLNPEVSMRKLDHVRQDGKTARGLFFLSPIFTKEDYPQRDPHIDLEELKPPKHKFHKVTRKLLRLRNNRPKSMEVMDALDYQPLTDEIPLPTPEEALRRMCKSQPSLCVVEVDTAGTSFNRMCAFRQSLHHIDFESLDTGEAVEQFNPDAKPIERKRKRRQTLTGIPGHIAKELSLFRTKNSEKLRSSVRDRPKTTDFETHRHLHQSPWIFLEAETAEFVGAVDRRFRLRKRDDGLYASIRRCNSLPRMSRKKAVAQEEKPPYKVAMPLVRTLSDSRLNVKKKAKEQDGSFHSLTRSVSFAGRGKAWLASSRVRPKSKEVLDDFGDTTQSPGTSDLDMRTMSSIGSGSKSTEDLKCSLQSLAAVYSRRGYTMPPAESLASVQLRENRNKKNKEDRQSSSGNWSGSSSSARHSLDSDYARPFHHSAERDSAVSLTVDHLPTAQETEGEEKAAEEEDRKDEEKRREEKQQSNQPSTDNTCEIMVTPAEEESKLNVDEANKEDFEKENVVKTEDAHDGSDFTHMDTDAWLASLERKKSKMKSEPNSPFKATSTDPDELRPEEKNYVHPDFRKFMQPDFRRLSQASTGSSLSSDPRRLSYIDDSSSVSSEGLSISQLTKENVSMHDALDNVLENLGTNFDDELGSVHSVDDDGFYTSFHTDCGLTRSLSSYLNNPKFESLIDEEELSEKERKELNRLSTYSNWSITSFRSIDSVIYVPPPAEKQLESAEKKGSISSKDAIEKVAMWQKAHSSIPTPPVDDYSVNNKDEFMQHPKPPQKKTPPPPPTRTTTLQNFKADKVEIDSLHEPSPRMPHSASEPVMLNPDRQTQKQQIQRQTSLDNSEAGKRRGSLQSTTSTASGATTTSKVEAKLREVKDKIADLVSGNKKESSAKLIDSMRLTSDSDADSSDGDPADVQDFDKSMKLGEVDTYVKFDVTEQDWSEVSSMSSFSFNEDVDTDSTHNRLVNKTSFNSSMYPSWCSVTPVPSDDDSMGHGDSPDIGTKYTQPDFRPFSSVSAVTSNLEGNTTANSIKEKYSIVTEPESSVHVLQRVPATPDTSCDSLDVTVLPNTTSDTTPSTTSPAVAKGTPLSLTTAPSPVWARRFPEPEKPNIQGILKRPKTTTAAATTKPSSKSNNEQTTQPMKVINFVPGTSIYEAEIQITPNKDKAPPRPPKTFLKEGSTFDEDSDRTRKPLPPLPQDENKSMKNMNCLPWPLELPYQESPTGNAMVIANLHAYNSMEKQIVSPDHTPTGSPVKTARYPLAANGVHSIVSPDRTPTASPVLELQETGGFRSVDSVFSTSSQSQSPSANYVVMSPSVLPSGHSPEYTPTGSLSRYSYTSSASSRSSGLFSGSMSPPSTPSNSNPTTPYGTLTREGRPPSGLSSYSVSPVTTPTGSGQVTPTGSLDRRVISHRGSSGRLVFQGGSTGSLSRSRSGSSGSRTSAYGSASTGRSPGNTPTTPVTPVEEDAPPPLPPKYMPTIIVKPRVRGEGSSSRSGSRASWEGYSYDYAGSSNSTPTNSLDRKQARVSLTHTPYNSPDQTGGNTNVQRTGTSTAIREPIYANCPGAKSSFRTSPKTLASASVKLIREPIYANIKKAQYPLAVHATIASGIVPAKSINTMATQKGNADFEQLSGIESRPRVSPKTADPSDQQPRFTSYKGPNSLSSAVGGQHISRETGQILINNVRSGQTFTESEMHRVSVPSQSRSTRASFHGESSTLPKEENKAHRPTSLIMPGQTKPAPPTRSLSTPTGSYKPVTPVRSTPSPTQYKSGPPTPLRTTPSPSGSTYQSHHNIKSSSVPSAPQDTKSVENFKQLLSNQLQRNSQFSAAQALHIHQEEMSDGESSVSSHTSASSTQRHMVSIKEIRQAVGKPSQLNGPSPIPQQKSPQGHPSPLNGISSTQCPQQSTARQTLLAGSTASTQYPTQRVPQQNTLPGRSMGQQGEKMHKTAPTHPGHYGSLDRRSSMGIVRSTSQHGEAHAVIRPQSSITSATSPTMQPTGVPLNHVQNHTQRHVIPPYQGQGYSQNHVSPSSQIQSSVTNNVKQGPPSPRRNQIHYVQPMQQSSPPLPARSNRQPKQPQVLPQEKPEPHYPDVIQAHTGQKGNSLGVPLRGAAKLMAKQSGHLVQMRRQTWAKSSERLPMETRSEFRKSSGSLNELAVLSLIDDIKLKIGTDGIEVEQDDRGVIHTCV